MASAVAAGVVATETKITSLTDLPSWLAEGRVLPSKFLAQLNGIHYRHINHCLYFSVSIIYAIVWC
jgi:hypothetical protein